MDRITPAPTVRPARPAMTPAPDEPGTLCEQLLAVLDWLAEPDAIRADPQSWERSRGRWIAHTGRSASDRRA